MLISRSDGSMLTYASFGDQRCKSKLNINVSFVWLLCILSAQYSPTLLIVHYYQNIKFCYFKKIYRSKKICLKHRSTLTQLTPSEAEGIMHRTQLDQSDHKNQLLIIWDLCLMPDVKVVRKLLIFFSIFWKTVFVCFVFFTNFEWWC